MVKTKILLVEDDKSLREIYGVRLYSEGYDIISAGDGEEALALAIKERPSLIISDVMMPKISGFDMLDILRSTSETKTIKVIMMTALSSEDQRARGEALGADRYLVKSQVGIEDVVRTVHDVLGDAPVSGNTAAANLTPAATTAPTPAPQPYLSTPGATGTGASLPEPTAPFSTSRPASLGDRVIHPLASSEPTQDFGAMMNAELGGAPQPAPEPVLNIPPSAPMQPLVDTAPDFEALIPPIPAAAMQPDTSDDSAPLIPMPQTPPPVDSTIDLPPMPQPTVPEPATQTPMASPASFTTPATTQPITTPEQPTPTAGLSFEETPYTQPPAQMPVPNPALSGDIILPTPTASAPQPTLATPQPAQSQPVAPTPAPQTTNEPIHDTVDVSNADENEPPLVVPPRA